MADYYWNWDEQVGLTIINNDNRELFDVVRNLINKNQKTNEFEIKHNDNWYKLSVLNKEKTSKSGILCDITKYKKQIHEYQELAYKDSVTGIHNRLGLLKRLETFDFNQNTAIIFLDLDNFKQLNDLYGHDAGDEMLKLVATSIQQALPRDAYVSRYSGDEFILFISQNVNPVVLNMLLSDIIEAVIHANDHAIMDDAKVTASMGVATSPNMSTNLNDLITKADIAMYVAKKQGKAKFLFYNSQIEQSYFEYSKIHKQLLKAFKQNEFKFQYQPIYDLQKQKIEMVEVFTYWDHPSRGIIEHEELLQTVYEEGLILTFDEWMIEEAIKQIADLNQNGINIKMSINISPKQLADVHFHHIVKRTLERYSVLGSSLYIEMIEFILKEEFDSINYNFRMLNDLGCKIIIDGFGINQSTISMIKVLNLDMIKINKYFVETIENEESSEIIFNTILKLANAHNKQFIADGVMDEVQFRLIKEKGCKFAQGSFLSDRKDLRATVEMIKRGRKI